MRFRRFLALGLLIVALAGQQVVATAQDIRNTPRDSSTSDAYRALVGDYDSEGQLNITLHISVEGGDLVLSNSVDPTPKRLIPEDVGNLQFVIDHPTPDQVVFATDDRGNVTYCVVRLANDGVEMTFRRVSSDGEASPDQQETTAGSLADYGWDQSEAAYDSGKIDELRAMIEDGTYKQVKSVIVIKDGDLLVEEYFNGAVRDELHDPRSVSKTYASAITGIAISEGYLSGVDESLGDVYNLENYDNVGPKKEEVRIEDLLTMSSGFEGFDFDPASIGNERNMYAKTDWVKWALDLPMATERSPGDEWYYFTAGVVILGDILNRRVPGGLEAYARQKLFKPLGIERYVWPRTTQGAPSTAGGLRLTPLDMAKFGQLYFDEGEWRGQRVLPQEWVDESLRRRYQTTEGVWYGYLWWNRVYNIEGEQYEAYFCNGNGGNKILLFREHGIVIVVASSAYDEAYADPQVDQMITRYILPAVTPE